MSVLLLNKEFRRHKNRIHVTQHQHCIYLLLCIHWMHSLTTKELWVCTIFHFHKEWEHCVIFALPINVHFYLPMLYFGKIVLYGFISCTNICYCTLSDGLRPTIMEQICQPSLCIFYSWHGLHCNRAELLISNRFDLNID